MIETIYKPDILQLGSLLVRPAASKNITTAVADILQNVKQFGDKAVAEYTYRFDGYLSPVLEVTEEELYQGTSNTSESLKNAIDLAISNIEKFHLTQKEEVKYVNTANGVCCWRKSVGIERIGIYIPGGNAPLFSTLLMLAVPAKIAGCSEIVMCTPPDSKGAINAAILYAAKRVGIQKIYKVGGAQAFM